MEALKEHAFSYFTKPFSDEEIRAMVERALAAPDWDDGIEVLSDKPDWISVRASCRRLTADRLLKFVDELSSDLSEDDSKSTGAAFREILMNAIEHGAQFDAAKRVEITRVRTAGLLMYLVSDPGPGFDYANLPHAAVSSPDDPVRHVGFRDAHGMRAGGFGLLVAGGMVDELVHNSTGNQAVLIKYPVRQTSGSTAHIAGPESVTRPDVTATPTRLLCEADIARHASTAAGLHPLNCRECVHQHPRECRRHGSPEQASNTSLAPPGIR